MPRTIRLELDEHGDRLRGRVAESGHDEQEFEGWLGLLTLLGERLDGPREPDGTEDEG
ncbi:hypothetical protein [Conexibacter woesei]|nr:hypothetical protein [Conexibacter woesei]